MGRISNEKLVPDGYQICDSFCDNKDLLKVSKQVKKFYKKIISEGIFYSKDEAKAIGLIKENNGHFIRAWIEEDYKGPAVKLAYEDNLMYNELNWFFETQTFKKLVEKLIVYTGPDLNMSMAKLVITLPVSLYPDYIKKIYLTKEKILRGSLIPLVKERFRKAFFFALNPWHQDTIDYLDSDNQSYTALISLTDRSNDEAPLYICPESSALGDVPYPINFSLKKDYIIYKNEQGKFKLKIKRVRLNPGDLIMWHAFTFHTVLPNYSKEPAVALRFNFAPSSAYDGINDKRNVIKVSQSPLAKFTAEGGEKINHLKIS